MDFKQGEEMKQKILKPKIRITPIGFGTAIDHITPGMGLRIVEVIKVEKDNAISIAINTESKKLGRKDLILFENKFLNEKELDKVKLLARNATHNVIKDFKIVEKERLGLPERVSEIIECINPTCITNHEMIPTKFIITKKKPLQAKCYYCETVMEEEEIMRAVK